MSIQNLNNLLDGSEIKVVSVGSRKIGIIGTVIIATSLAMGAGALYLHNNKDNTVSTHDTGIINSIKEKITEVATPSIQNKIINPIYGNQISDSKLKEKLEKAGNFEVPSELKPNQISRYVSQIEFKEKNYLLSLVSEGEGFRNHLYNDNIGFAFGNGWNLSMQTSAYNKIIASSISKDQDYIDKLVMLSGKTSDAKIPENFNNVTITPQRSIQVSQLMSIEFEKSVLQVIEKQLPKNENAKKLNKKTGKDFSVMSHDIFNDLKENQKAALVYHTYKVGGGGLNKYTGLVQSLIDYSLSPEKTQAKEKEIAEHFTYKYKMNGEIKEDLRASVLVSTMFLDENAFGYVIGKNVAPKNMKENIPIFEKYKIDIPTNANDLKIPDPVGEKRQELENYGQKVQIQIVPEDSVSLLNEKNRSKPKATKGYWF